jgi:hypothetical protein
VILSSHLSDDDEGVVEALRRDAEIEADSAKAISLVELDSQSQGRRAEVRGDEVLARVRSLLDEDMPSS